MFGACKILSHGWVLVQVYSIGQVFPLVESALNALWLPHDIPAPIVTMTISWQASPYAVYSWESL